MIRCFYHKAENVILFFLTLSSPRLARCHVHLNLLVFVTLLISGDVCGGQSAMYVKNCYNSRYVVSFCVAVSKAVLIFLLLLLLLALQPTVGFSLLSDFLQFCSFFTLLSPLSYFHYLQIFYYHICVLIAGSSSFPQGQSGFYYRVLRNSLVFQGRVVSPAPNPQPGGILTFISSYCLLLLYAISLFNASLFATVVNTVT
jgi:hypothetical protein